MPKAVFDSTVLVSALLNFNPGGVSFELLRFAGQGLFELFISDDIVAETVKTLRTPRLRKYVTSDAVIVSYADDLKRLSTFVSDPVPVRVVRDPNDDMIVGCALAAGADYIVSRDKDLLSLSEYAGIRIVTPEAFLGTLREAAEKK